MIRGFLQHGCRSFRRWITLRAAINSLYSTGTMFSTVLLLSFLTACHQRNFSLASQKTGERFSASLVKDEKTANGFYSKVLVDERYVSKSDLETIFRWYSLRHSDRGETLTLKVYTNSAMLDTDDWDEGLRASTEPQATSYVAYYSRDSGDQNEFYFYAPNPKDTTVQESVTLNKGR